MQQRRQSHEPVQAITMLASSSRASTDACPHKGVRTVHKRRTTSAPPCNTNIKAAGSSKRTLNESQSIPTPWPSSAVQPSASTARFDKSSKAPLRCYLCGQIGHFTTDTKCPNFRKKPTLVQRMFAQRVIDNTSDHKVDTIDQAEAELAGVTEKTPADDTEAEEANKEGREYPLSDYELDGSQYDPEGEMYHSEEDTMEYSGAMCIALIKEADNVPLCIHSMTIAPT